MGILRSFWGPSKKEVWKQIAVDMGGEYEKGGFFRDDALRYRHQHWDITMKTYKTQHLSLTSMEAPFIKRDGLSFGITREGIFSEMGKFFGMQDIIIIDDRYFDQNFVIKGNNEKKIRLLLRSAKLKALIQIQADVTLGICKGNGFFENRFPDGVDILSFRCRGILKDKKRLRNLFEIFTITLDRLVQIGSAHKDDPKVMLC